MIFWFENKKHYEHITFHLRSIAKLLVFHRPNFHDLDFLGKILFALM